MAATGASHLAWYFHPFDTPIPGHFANCRLHVVRLDLASHHSRVLANELCYTIYPFPAYLTTTAWPGRALGGMPLGVPTHFFDRLVLRRWAFGDGQPGPNSAIKKNLEGKRKKLDGTDGYQWNESTFLDRMAFG